MHCIGGWLKCYLRTCSFFHVYVSLEHKVLLLCWYLEMARMWIICSLSCEQLPIITSALSRNIISFLWFGICFRKWPKSWRRVSTSMLSLVCRFTAALPASGRASQPGSSSIRSTHPTWDGWSKFPGSSKCSVETYSRQAIFYKKTNTVLLTQSRSKYSCKKGI